MNTEHHPSTATNIKSAAETNSSKSGLRSNPSLSAENSGFKPEFAGFLDDLKKVWQQVAQKPKYRTARLVHYDYDLSKRWYVIFYAWNVRTERVERKRMFEPINREKSVNARLSVANQMIAQFNSELRAGKVLGKLDMKNVSNGIKMHVERLTITAAIDLFVSEKRKALRRRNYLKKYDTMKSHMLEFCEYANIDEPTINQIVKDTEFVEAFLSWLRDKSKSGKTFNNYRSDLSILLNWLNKKKAKKLFAFNPVHMVEKTQVAGKKKHAAFSDEQIKAIVNKASELGYTQLVLFIRFVYYTLARPQEILSIRVRDIDLQNDRIIIRGDEAKNWQNEYVHISTQFKQIIQEAGILAFDGEYFVFSKNEQPGPVAYRSHSNFYAWFRKIVRDELSLHKINQNYSVYSLKHSGAISLYLATLDIYAVKEQCRHSDISQTDEYLRDLGLLRKTQPVRGWKGAA